MTRLAILAAAIALAGCGGQVSAKPLNVCLQPSDRIEVMRGCDAVIQPTPELDPVKSAALQASLGPVVIGWIGGDQGGTTGKVTAQGAITPAITSRAPALIAAMAAYPNIEAVYAADEYGHCDTSACLYEHAAALLTITQLAHAAGKKVIVSVLPGTLALYPDAPMPGIEQIDGIALVMYPSIPLQADFPGCNYPGNKSISTARCSFDKLERMGWHGKRLLAFQGFKLTTDTDADLLANLLLQRELIDQAGALGIYAVASWGCHLGAGELRREPYLVPLCGTQYEGLVTP